MRLLTLGSIPSRWGGGSDGGVAEVHAMMAQHLSAQGGDCSYLGLVAPNRAAAARLPPVRLHELPEDMRAQRDWYLNLLDQLRPDAVLFFHIAHRFAQWHAAHARHIAGIGAIHSWSPILAADDEKRPGKIAAMHKAIAGMRRLVFVSAHCRVEGQALGFDYQGKDSVISNPLQGAFASGLVERSKPERARILFAGRLEEVKRPGLLLETAPLLDADFVFLGDGALRQPLEQRAQELGVGSRVWFHGSVSMERVQAEMLGADLLCVPSARESFGLIYIEALACGTPVVGYAPAVAEIEALCGLAVGAGIGAAGTVDDLLAALRRVLRQEWPRERLAATARARYALEEIMRAYHKLIASACTQPES